MELRKGQFRLDSYGAQVFEGWTEGDTWNGWATPMFEKPAADQIVEATLRMWATINDAADEEDRVTVATAWRDDATDTYYFREDPETSSEDVILCTGYDVAGPDGQTLHLYNVGTHGWTWEMGPVPVAVGA